MHIKFSIVIVTWLLGGGHVVYNGFELFGSKARTTRESQETTPKLTETKLPEKKGHLASIFESIFGKKKIGNEEEAIQTRVEETVKSVPFWNHLFGEYSTADVEKTADKSEVVDEPLQASYSFIDYLFGQSAPSTNKQKKEEFVTTENVGDGKSVHGTSFMNWLNEKITGKNNENLPTERNEKRKEDSDVEEKRQKLAAEEKRQTSMGAGVIGMVLDICQRHAVFLAGVVIPFFAPGMWPWFGRLFWSLVAVLQFACGVKKSKLAQHLGMKWAAGDAVTTTTASGGAIMNSTRTLHGETGILASNVVDDEAGMVNGFSTPTEEIDEIPQITPPRTTHEEERSSENESTCSTTTTTSTATTVVEVVASAAAAAKSLPIIEGHPVEAAQRSCNSETVCKDGAVVKKRDGMERIASRPRRLGLKINDIRRLAPPRDATASIRGAILEVEQRRRAKDSVRLLEHGEHQFPELFEGEDAEIVRRGLADSADAGECPRKTEGETPLQRRWRRGDGANAAAVGEAKK